MIMCGGVIISDFNGEPLNYNAKARLNRAIDQLIGLCSGIAADGAVNEKEIAFLATWLSEHTEVAAEFPGNQIARRLRDVMSDGVVTADEAADLLDTLQQISGNHFSETGAAAADAAAVVADDPAVVEFVGKRFCFSGKFAFGQRKACHAAVIDLGAQCDDDITLKTDYLVVGLCNSADWKHESFGRKIERVEKLRANGNERPLILTEKAWAAALAEERLRGAR